MLEPNQDKDTRIAFLTVLEGFEEQPVFTTVLLLASGSRTIRKTLSTVQMGLTSVTSSLSPTKNPGRVSRVNHQAIVALGPPGPSGCIIFNKH